MRPRIAVATAAAAAAGLVAIGLAIAGGDGDGGSAPGGTTSSRPPSTATTAEPANTTATTTTSTSTALPSASTTPASTTPASTTVPWLRPPLPQDQAPAEFVAAWERAGNRDRCALIVPTDLGPRFDGARTGSSPTNDDAGWDIVYRKEAAIVQILGLFPVSTAEGGTAPYSRQWEDGSVARYGPDDPDPRGADPDPERVPNEAVLIIPGQDCAYRIYDTLGRTHLERVLDSLRFVEG